MQLSVLACFDHVCGVEIIDRHRRLIINIRSVPRLLLDHIPTGSFGHRAKLSDVLPKMGMTGHHETGPKKRIGAFFERCVAVYRRTNMLVCTTFPTVHPIWNAVLLDQPFHAAMK